MKSTLLAFNCAVVLTFFQAGWSAPKAAPAPAPAASTVKDTGAAPAEPVQSVWDSAAVAPPAEAAVPGDSTQGGEKAAKAEAKAAPGKAVKAPLDSSGGKASGAKPGSKPAPAKAEPKTPEDFKKIGDQFAKKSQTDKAMAAYKQCIEMAGDDTAYGKVIKMLADYSQAKKQYAEAVKYYSMVKGKAREQMPFQVMYARALQLSGKNAEAIEILEPLAADQKIKVEAKKEMMKILGDAYCKTDMNDKAVAWYGKYLKAGGTKTGDMVFLLAYSLEKSGPLKAKMKYEENIKSFPADYRNYLHLGIILAKTKATAQRGAALLKKAADLAGSVPSVWLEIGKTYGSVGKTDEELSAYQTALRIDPNNLQAKTRIGSILLIKGLTTDAIEMLEAAHKQAPDSAGPMASLASAYIKTGKAKEAIDLLVKAKAAKPKDLAIRRNLFDAYRKTGQDQPALEEIKAVLELKRDNDALLAYGKLLLKMGKLDDAASTMEDIRSTQPDNLDALMTLAMVKREQKKFDEAIEIYKEVSSIDSKAAAPLYERAEVYLSQSKMKWAEQFYQRALEADPQMAAAQVGLAKLALAYGNRQGYLDLLDKAASMNPDDPVVKKELENSRKPAPAGKK
jgi:tetratricopeptide (TPR) repeat protein